MTSAMQTSSAAARADRDQLECVQGRIAFARRSADEQAPEAVSAGGYEDVPMVFYDVPIRNARSIVDELSLEREGFILVPHRIDCADEPDPPMLRRKYLEEMVPFIKDYFGASWVMPHDLGGVTLRTVAENFVHRAEATPDQRTVRNWGSGFAHIDFASVSGPMVAARDCQLHGIEIQAYSRLMIIQAWHAISPPPQNFPLAFCDSLSIRPDDLHEAHYRKYGGSSKSWVLRHNQAHRWYYLPEMTADEFFLFKGYGSDTHHRPWSAHAMFDNRAAYPNANTRRSIEARFYVYYS
jgi:hypothetical protein